MRNQLERELLKLGAERRLEELHAEEVKLTTFLKTTAPRTKVKTRTVYRTHWTQRPENRAKVRRVLAKASQARATKQNGNGSAPAFKS